MAKMTPLETLKAYWGFDKEARLFVEFMELMLHECKVCTVERWIEFRDTMKALEADNNG